MDVGLQHPPHRVLLVGGNDLVQHRWDDLALGPLSTGSNRNRPNREPRVILDVRESVEQFLGSLLGFAQLRGDVAFVARDVARVKDGHRHGASLCAIRNDADIFF